MKKTHKFTTVCLAILMAMTVSACQDRPTLNDIDAKITQKSEEKQGEKPNQALPTEALKTIDQTLSGANKIANAKEVKFSTTPYVYELPKAMKEACNFNEKVAKNNADENGFCTKIDIELAKVEPLWIEQIVNKLITDDDNPKLIKFNQTVDNFVEEHLMLINEMKDLAKEENKTFEYAPSYAWVQKPKLLPAFNNLVQIAIAQDVYTGGAHGMQNTSYLIFDMDLQSQIKFNDIIHNDKTGELHDLYYTAFKEYLAKDLEINSEKEIKEYEQTWEFKLSDNAYFSKDGLVMVYQPYEMGSYAQGFIELTVPYDKLSGVLKGQYMPNSQI